MVLWGLAANGEFLKQSLTLAESAIRNFNQRRAFLFIGSVIAFFAYEALIEINTNRKSVLIKSRRIDIRLERAFYLP